MNPMKKTPWLAGVVHHATIPDAYKEVWPECRAKSTEWNGIENVVVMIPCRTVEELQKVMEVKKNTV
jgi:hypothetical protein